MEADNSDTIFRGERKFNLFSYFKFLIQVFGKIFNKSLISLSQTDPCIKSMGIYSSNCGLAYTQERFITAPESEANSVCENS